MCPVVPGKVPGEPTRGDLLPRGPQGWGVPRRSAVPCSSPGQGEIFRRLSFPGESLPRPGADLLGICGVFITPHPLDASSKGYRSCRLSCFWGGG